MKILCIVISLCLSFQLANAAGEETSLKTQVDKIVSMIKSGNSLDASKRLLDLLNRNQIPSARPHLKYLFGLSLMEQNLNQVAAFQFVDVVRSADAKWTKPAIEKLLIVTDKLGDETLLNFGSQDLFDEAKFMQALEYASSQMDASVESFTREWMKLDKLPTYNNQNHPKFALVSQGLVIDDSLRKAMGDLHRKIARRRRGRCSCRAVGLRRFDLPLSRISGLAEM